MLETLAGLVKPDKGRVYIDDKDVRATKFHGKFSKFVFKSKQVEVFE